jgi:hypothetical protein
MPAGNDAQAAARELADQFGQGAGTAEALIQSSRERYAGDLAQAQLAEKDDEATAELDYGDVAKSAGVKKDEVLDASVRGEFVVYLVEEDGRTAKGAVPKDDLGKAPKKAESESGSKSGGSKSGSTSGSKSAKA